MASKMVEFFWEYPVRFILRLFLTVAVLCLLLTFMPKWFNAVFGIVMMGAFIVIIIKWETKEKEKQHQQENTMLKNYQKLYAEYGELVCRKIEELGVDENHIRDNWFHVFYDYFQKASTLCYRTKFTDFHVAACIIFSLVSYTDDIEHTDIIYKCIRDFIANPRVYMSHNNNSDEITLKVEQNLSEVNLAVIEEVIDSVQFAKIIKEMYIKNKNGKSLIELANFLRRVYLSCI